MSAAQKHIAEVTKTVEIYIDYISIELKLFTK